MFVRARRDAEEQRGRGRGEQEERLDREHEHDFVRARRRGRQPGLRVQVDTEQRALERPRHRVQHAAKRRRLYFACASDSFYVNVMTF